MVVALASVAYKEIRLGLDLPHDTLCSFALAWGDTNIMLVNSLWGVPFT